MACGRSQEERDRLRFKTLESMLPLVGGTIIKEDGSVVDIPDLIGHIQKTPLNPQIAKSQAIRPYIRDLLILRDGKTCRLTDIIENLITNVHDVFTDELRLDTTTLLEEDW